MVKKLRRIKPPKGGLEYRRIWREVDGALTDTFKHHPEYIVQGRMRSARESIIKRVTGSVCGYLAHKAKCGRTGRRSGGSTGEAG